MATRRKKNAAEQRVDDFRYEATRKNNPPVGLTSYEPRLQEPQIARYAYDPHLSPQLVWAGKPGLTSIEVEDAAGVQVETVPLHIHERVSTRAIIDAVRRPEPKQLDLFADPQLPLTDAVRFYEHDVDWANRLILGDSLVVMNSLLERELLAGKVQMIYVDPPYGVKYASNFQPRIDRRDVKDADDDLSREPEMIKAYRDTWTLGVHSYLTYLRDRLRLCRELLAETGSIFVQIGDENVHRVRCIMDDVFGAENFISQITFRTTANLVGNYLGRNSDFLLWYSRDYSNAKYRQLYTEQTIADDIGGRYSRVELPDGSRRVLSSSERNDTSALPSLCRIYRHDNLTSQGASESGTIPFTFEGQIYHPGRNRHWTTTNSGLERLTAAHRLAAPTSNSLAYVRFITDFPVREVTNVWTDTQTGAFTDPKVYVVQTNTKVIERCLLMTTDPGDLVLDPTCGSGTTAHVAEQWGRRWITCDTSRVALSLARQRLLTATFPYYKLADPDQGVSGGFQYKTVPHITLKSIAQNTRIDPIAENYQRQIDAILAGGGGNPDDERVKALRLAQKREIDAIIAQDAEQETLYDQPYDDRGVVRVSGPFTVEAIPPAVLNLQAESPIAGAPEPDGHASDESLPDVLLTTETTGEAALIPRLIDLLRKDGVTFPANRSMTFADLRPLAAGVLHAEGEPEGEATPTRVAISFGPENGAISVRQVEDGLRAANRAGYDAVIFAGFAFQAAAQQAISDIAHPNLQVFMAHIRPDVIMTDTRGEPLLKTTANNQLFAVFGEPDISLHTHPDATHTVELRGVDIYDPLTGEVHSANAGQIAAWFLDTDYDERCFAICQAYFPDKKAWDKLARALKGTLDDDRFDQLTGRVSLPFQPGQHNKVAVKVIDQRGNEVMRVLPLDAESKPYDYAAGGDR